MFWKHRRDKPQIPPASEPEAPRETSTTGRRERDIGREDADSPSAIPVLPPRGDGS